jgi:hypothetical protein
LEKQSRYDRICKQKRNHCRQTKVEAKFQEWANKPENKATYGNVLSEIEAYYKQIADRNLERNYASQFQRNAKYSVLPYRIGSALKSFTEQDAAARTAMKAKL